MKRRKLSEEQAAELVRAYQDGELLKIIAGRYQIHERSIRVYLERAGVPSTRKGGRPKMKRQDAHVPSH